MKSMLQLVIVAVAAVFLFIASGGQEASAREGLYGFSSGPDAFRARKYRQKSTTPKAVGKRKARRRSAKKRRYRKARSRYSVKRRGYRKARKKARKKARAKVAKPVVKVEAKDPVQLVISIPDQRVHVYKGDKRIASSRVSTGRPGHRTPSGVFSIIQKNRRHYSNLYNSAPMPYMQRITWSGIALHAGNVSRPYASHGCIRLPYGFAKGLFRKTKMGAHVIVSSGMASPRAIQHETLLQPMPGVAKTEDVGTATSANPDVEQEDAGRKSDDSDPLQNFAPPVEAAVNMLEERKIELEKAKSSVAPVEKNLAIAVERGKKRQAALVLADKIVASKNRDVRAAYKVVRNEQAVLDKINRRLKKAKSGVKWSQGLIDKRRDNPRYEGIWMRGALKRLAERKAKVAAIEAEAEEVKVRLGPLKAEHIGAKLQLQKAVELVEIRKAKLDNARKMERTRKAQLKKSKAEVKTAQLNVKRATSELRASQAREKMPLRILVTPHRGRERIKNAQRLLAELGYDVGPVDGVVGKGTRGAIKEFERAMERKETGVVSEELLKDLYQKAGKEQVANAHMYVRQGFLDLFDVPVEVDTPERPLGTHVFTAKHFDDDAMRAEWTALTVKERLRRKGKGKKKRAKGGFIKVTAREALDRVRIPAYARRHLARMLTPGSSIVVSDKGISYETGKGTDFVILTK